MRGGNDPCLVLRENGFDSGTSRHPRFEQRVGAVRGVKTISPTFPLTGVCANGVFVPFMKVVSSIKSAKKRHPACQVVRRKGCIYVINKVEPRYKARQG